MGSIGIIMIATGHANYLRMAVTLAASIRHQSAIDICLVHDGGYYFLEPVEQRLFTHNVISLSQNGIRDKVMLYELSPCDKTLYLDVDMIVLPTVNIDTFISSLAGIPFTIMNHYKKDACIWAEIEKVREASGNNTDPLFIPYSEVMYFERSEQVKEMFAEAERQYDNPIEHVSFGGTMPDELAFLIACLKIGIKPHAYNWMPSFWFFRDKRDAARQPHELGRRYIFYSIGGNSLPEYIKAYYNNLSIYYCKAVGINKPYQARDKKTFLRNRSKI